MAISVTHSKTLIAPDSGAEDKVYGVDYVAADSHTVTGAAASGANSDITSLAGLTTPLSRGQGGNGNTLGNAGSIIYLAVNFGGYL
jgi:hypothetical protein